MRQQILTKVVSYERPGEAADDPREIRTIRTYPDASHQTSADPSRIKAKDSAEDLPLASARDPCNANLDIQFSSCAGRPRFSVLLTEKKAHWAVMGYKRVKNTCHMDGLVKVFGSLIRFRQYGSEEGLLLWVEVQEELFHTIPTINSDLRKEIEYAYKFIVAYSELLVKPLPYIDEYARKYIIENPRHVELSAGDQTLTPSSTVSRIRRRNKPSTIRARSELSIFIPRKPKKSAGPAKLNRSTEDNLPRLSTDLVPVSGVGRPTNPGIQLSTGEHSPTPQKARVQASADEHHKSSKRKRTTEDADGDNDLQDLEHSKSDEQRSGRDGVEKGAGEYKGREKSMVDHRG